MGKKAAELYIHIGHPEMNTWGITGYSSILLVFERSPSTVYTVQYQQALPVLEVIPFTWVTWFLSPLEFGATALKKNHVVRIGTDGFGFNMLGFKDGWMTSSCVCHAFCLKGLAPCRGFGTHYRAPCDCSSLRDIFRLQTRSLW